MINSKIPQRSKALLLWRTLLFSFFSSLKIASLDAQIGPIAIRPELGVARLEGSFVAGIALVNPYFAASFSMGNRDGPRTKTGAKTRTGAIKFYFGPCSHKAENFRKWYAKAFLTNLRTPSGERYNISGLAVGRDFYFCPFAGLSLDIGFAGAQQSSGTQIEGMKYLSTFNLRLWGQVPL
jgi:hypothetical protein